MKTLTWKDLEKAAGGTEQEQIYMMNYSSAFGYGTIGTSGNEYARKPLGYGLGEPRYQSNSHALK